MKIDDEFWYVANKVFDILKDPNNQKAFAENISKTGLRGDNSFSNLLHAYLLWSEVGSVEDIERYYGYLDDEDEGVSK